MCPVHVPKPAKTSPMYINILPPTMYLPVTHCHVIGDGYKSNSLRRKGCPRLYSGPPLQEQGLVGVQCGYEREPRGGRECGGEGCHSPGTE